MEHPGFLIPKEKALVRLIAALVCALTIIAAGNSRVGAQPTPEGCVTEPCVVNNLTYLPLIHSQKATLETLFGVQVYGELDVPGAGLELAHRASASWLRTQISWRSVEPANVEPQDYRFEAYDQSLLSAMEQGIRPIVTIGENPSWAATYANGPIDAADLEEFGKFIGAAVERYDGDGIDDAPGSPRVRYWEFYNEPDSGDALRAEYGQAFWGGYGEQYAEMLCRAYWYAKGASSDAQIVFGGVAHDWFQDEGGPFVRSFVEDALAAGAGKCIDVMNFHYYPVFASRWDPFGPGIAGKAEYFRGLLAKYGIPNKPLMSTEAGWHSDPNGEHASSLQKQAEFVVKVFTQAKAARLLVNIWWTWIDPGSTVGSYGLLYRGGAPKPSYYAYQAAASKIGPATSVRALTAQELGHANLEAYSSSGSSLLYVLWSNDSMTHQVRLPGAQARLVDIYGNFIKIVTDAEDGSADGRLSVQVGSAPVYVENAQ